MVAGGGTWVMRSDGQSEDDGWRYEYQRAVMGLCLAVRVSERLQGGGAASCATVQSVQLGA